MTIRTLLIDNYDSYSYNLYQLIAQVNGEAPTVVYNDRITVAALVHDITAGKYHNIVISPGPGSPTIPADIGVCVALFKAQLQIPILGVCLGHQALAAAYNAAIVPAPEPVHGRLSAVAHSGHPLFWGVPSGRQYQVVRYHSLIVEEASLPPCLVPIAWTLGPHHALGLEVTSPRHGDGPEAVAFSDDSSDTGGVGVEGRDSLSPSPSPSPPPPSPVDGTAAAVGGGGVAAGDHTRRAPPVVVGSPHSRASSGSGDDGSSAGTAAHGKLVMGLAHATLPHYGVQYHPESIATGHGTALLRNFRDLTCAFHGLSPVDGPAGEGGNTSGAAVTEAEAETSSVEVCYAEVPGVLQLLGGSEGLFKATVLHDAVQRSTCDSSHPSAASAALEDTFWLDSSAPDRGRFSFMGGPGGALWRRVTYTLPPVSASSSQQQHQQDGVESMPGTLTSVDAAGRTTETATTFWPWLDSELHRCRASTSHCTVLQQHSHAFVPGCPSDLPFNFWGGYVGYLGYELKAECGGRAAHVAPTPDAAFLLADQLLAVDHETGSVYAVALSRCGDAAGLNQAQSWVATTARRIERLAGVQKGAGAAGNGMGAVEGSSLPLVMSIRENHGSYLKNIAGCMQALHAGESYEICLTTQLSTSTPPDPWTFYLALRHINPAPYAAWLALKGGPTVCCSSPERFLRGERGGMLEAKPIKGTARRMMDDPRADAAAAAALEASEKDRAENLMIVDLLRNDLGRVCETGSVHVPALMRVESFATVHQLVSTVKGKRKEGTSVVECVRAAFPGGSMTGAPKLRTMAIIDALEGGPRGIYSGSMGYISFNDTFDLNIVIRTAAVHGGAATIGAGGAIVAQSEPAAEWEEMRLKCGALLRAMEGTAGRKVVVEGGE